MSVGVNKKEQDKCGEVQHSIDRLTTPAFKPDQDGGVNFLPILQELEGSKFINMVVADFADMETSKTRTLNLIKRNFGEITEIHKTYVDGVDHAYVVFITEKNAVGGYKVINKTISDLKIFTTNKYDVELRKLIKTIHRMVKAANDKREASIFLLTSNMYGLSLKSYEAEDLLKDKGSVFSHYNDDFEEIYEETVEFLNSDDSGLAIFSGVAGSGKTTLITHLASKVNKKVVFVPAGLVTMLVDPSNTSFLTTYLKDSILILEDAEEILYSRKEGGSTNAVSSLLSITDGILGNLLKSKVIATINYEEKLDEALLRRGRLAVKYTFENLAADKADALCKELGNEPLGLDLPLCDIYNYDKDAILEEHKNSDTDLGIDF